MCFLMDGIRRNKASRYLLNPWKCGPLVGIFQISINCIRYSLFPSIGGLLLGDHTGSHHLPSTNKSQRLLSILGNSVPYGSVIFVISYDYTLMEIRELCTSWHRILKVLSYTIFNVKGKLIFQAQSSFVCQFVIFLVFFFFFSKHFQRKCDSVLFVVLV